MSQIISDALAAAALTFTEARAALDRVKKDDAAIAQKMLLLSGRREFTQFGFTFHLTPELEAAFLRAREPLLREAEANYSRAEERLKKAADAQQAV